MICNVDTFQMFNIIKEIYENEYEKVYISNFKDKYKIIVLKVEVGNKKYLHNQYTILELLKFVQGVPKILNHGFGADEKFYYSIDYYAKSLAEILQKFGTLTLQSALSIGLSLLRILSGIHRQEIIYANICPENVVFSKEAVDHDQQLHLIGFGQAYLKQDKQKKLLNKNSLPYHIHNNRVSSKKDDLESLGYLLIKLIKGTLPWESLPQQLMGQKKIECLKSNEILQGLPYEFRFYFQQINLFHDEPNHAYLIKLLNSIMQKYCKTTQHCIIELNQLTPITETLNETDSSMDSCYLCTVIPQNMSNFNVLPNMELDSSIEEKLKRLQLISKQYKLISNL
ncbi:unnamed protein product (macronuclear) [Paramecium tetraurelia]|uniref:Casein kinase I n=1 Tax=Paramecium tetraurelia TaxID=5888 RepID=A0DHG4_PARTE|nr:uncharacterized protein GSPATT00016868001 [Paramecium tetraurelia]CAK82481.1 unnamed protein product [Paramecium tetraurelia]|eukprot:XP_001449878.1 hypothetical protein (macronuclear) [Paramecium tetraurelia strain d4-2]